MSRSLIITAGAVFMVAASLLSSIPGRSGPTPQQCCDPAHEGTTGLGWCGWGWCLDQSCNTGTVDTNDPVPGNCKDTGPGCAYNWLNAVVLIKYECKEYTEGCPPDTKFCEWTSIGVMASDQVLDCWDLQNSSLLCNPAQPGGG